MEIFFALVIILLTTAGQVFLKKGMTYRKEKSKSLQLIGLGYFLLTLTLIISYLLMKLIAMKYFTIIMSLNYIAVLLGSKMFLNEKFEQKNVIGTILVTLGIMIFFLDTVGK